MAPSSVEQALRENIQLKVEFQTLRTELKKYKKLLLEGDKAISNLTRERDDAVAARGSGGKSASARERELERELKRLREADREREEWETKARELQREVKRLRTGEGNEELEVSLLFFLLSLFFRRILISSGTAGPSCREQRPPKTPRRCSRRTRRAPTRGRRSTTGAGGWCRSVGRE
jgi:chaperonin cofactor prefoldin